MNTYTPNILEMLPTPVQALCGPRFDGFTTARHENDAPCRFFKQTSKSASITISMRSTSNEEDLERWDGMA